MPLRKALYAGTFDPFTNGHQDIVLRALSLFDELTLLVAVSPTKKPTLSQDQRLKLLREIFVNQPKVKVEAWDGLVVEYARQHQIGHIVRGLRPTGDFEVEFQMASMNRKLHADLDTVFLMTSEKLFYVSSSLVKEVWSHGGDISQFVPPRVLEELKKIKG